MQTERKLRFGTKWTCYSCGAKFYDLNKPEPICPKCGADQRESPAFQAARSKPPRPRRRSSPKRAMPPPLPSGLDDDEIPAEPERQAAEPVGIGLDARESEDNPLELAEDADSEA